MNTPTSNEKIDKVLQRLEEYEKLEVDF